MGLLSQAPSEPQPVPPGPSSVSPTTPDPSPGETKKKKKHGALMAESPRVLSWLAPNSGDSVVCLVQSRHSINIRRKNRWMEGWRKDGQTDRRMGGKGVKREGRPASSQRPSTPRLLLQGSRRHPSWSLQQPLGPPVRKAHPFTRSDFYVPALGKYLPRARTCAG